MAETELEYDDLGRVTDISHERADTILAQYNLTWDAAGRLVEFDFDSYAGDNGDTSYDYDETGQLTDVDYVSDWQGDESYTYDDNGNRITANGDDYETDDHNRLESIDDGVDLTFYEYDNEGNRILKYIDANESGDLNSGDTNITEYEWDHRNRLVSVTYYPDCGFYTSEIAYWVIDYTYDAQNQLIGRTLNEDPGQTPFDSSSVYIYQGGQIVLHYQVDNEYYEWSPLTDTDLAHRYLWGTGTDELLADEELSFYVAGVHDLTTPGTTRWALTDHQGSVRDLVEYNDNGTPTDLSDDTVTVEKHVVYDAYGNVTSETGTAESLFLYTGKFFDEDTGLQNNLNRWYDLSTGRWMSVDPIGFAGNDVNLYRYCGNGVTYATDPSGLIKVRILRQGTSKGDMKPDSATHNKLWVYHKFSDWRVGDPAGMIQKVTDSGTFSVVHSCGDAQVHWQESYLEGWVRGVMSSREYEFTDKHLVSPKQPAEGLETFLGEKFHIKNKKLYLGDCEVYSWSFTMTTDFEMQNTWPTDTSTWKYPTSNILDWRGARKIDWSVKYTASYKLDPSHHNTYLTISSTENEGFVRMLRPGPAGPPNTKYQQPTYQAKCHETWSVTWKQGEMKSKLKYTTTGYK